MTGTEIKSVRAGRVDLREAYARPLDGELWLLNAHIAQYDPASILQPRTPPSAQVADAQGRDSQSGGPGCPERADHRGPEALHQEPCSESRVGTGTRQAAIRQEAGHSRPGNGHGCPPGHAGRPLTPLCWRQQGTESVDFNRKGKAIRGEQMAHPVSHCGLCIIHHWQRILRYHKQEEHRILYGRTGQEDKVD